MESDDPSEAIEFGTDGWRAAGEEFTMSRVRAIGVAVAAFLDAADRSGPVAVGYDGRENSREAAEQLAAAVTASGRDVTLSERDCPTPVLAWTVRTGSYVGGLMVTASHNPPEYNGVKYILGDGTPARPNVTDELERRLTGRAPPQDAAGETSEATFTDAYADHAQSFVDADLDGLRIGYDAMHGSGRGVTDELLERAGADLTRFRCERDPTFGGGPPEPVAERAEELTTLVDEGAVSLGLINDGDADRLGVITPERGFVDPNVLLTVLYEYLLDHETEAGDVVRTVSTSSLVDRVARKAGQSVHETAVGFKWVAEAMVEHDALAGGEESGGYGIGSHLPNKDGVLLALVLSAAHAERPIDDRIDALLERHGTIVQDRRSLDCPDERKAAVIDSLEGTVPDRVADRAVAEIQTVDGFKIRLDDDSWVLIRPSGTEPKLRVYAEADSQRRVEELLDAGETLLRPHLD
ncbi:phosphoglucomutase/phosphomannomutase family protein [Halovenus sp. WSH3]|uniref:Phosphoglucomutase/phosphomannomutase family protein n=1 Tax=Halovenus carboxidivorans TaxID=2692199 RepID=A0A6B0SZN8_9EURY|nr:phosphoglucomutase/phosphomannomutase family protein [Halovenus carboxidivorans]MXR50985.1 phosphoglucomutase/phosphomannomutase family protein [Halovenus carboxidivorans]